MRSSKARGSSIEVIKAIRQARHHPTREGPSGKWRPPNPKTKTPVQIMEMDNIVSGPIADLVHRYYLVLLLDHVCEDLLPWMKVKRAIDYANRVRYLISLSQAPENLLGSKNNHIYISVFLGQPTVHKCYCHLHRQRTHQVLSWDIID